MSLEEQILERISPDAEQQERIDQAVMDLTRRAQEEIKRKCVEQSGIQAAPKMVGSIAKGTHLSKPDIDMFIMFPPSTSREDLERLGLALGHCLLEDRVEKYAEHPYVMGHFQGFEVDIVPAFAVLEASAKMSAVDRTPFHTQFISENLTAAQKDQARLLKAFQKGVGVYGAHVEVEGFPGYLCELLVHHYETFGRVLEAASQWAKGERIDLTGKGSKGFSQPLTFIDPVDSNRNVASALSLQSFSLFIHAAREYLANPAESFFFPKIPAPLSTMDALLLLEERDGTHGSHAIGIELGRPELVDDVLYSQVKKALRSAVRLLDNSGFLVLNSDYWLNSSKILLLFELGSDRLPSTRLHSGPPVWNKESSNFLQKWSDNEAALSEPKIVDGIWMVEVKRDYVDPQSLLDNRLLEVTLGKNLLESAQAGFEVLDGETLAGLYPASLGRLLNRRFPWKR